MTALALSLLFVPPPAFAAPSQPSCEVALDTHAVTARPTSTSSVTLSFTGSVNATLGSLSGSRIMSILAEIVPGDWAAAILPSTENITGTERVFFNATVAVPAAESSTTRGTLTVRASFQAVPGVQGSTVACSDVASISVAQYYDVTADTGHSRITVTAGPTGATANVILRNVGNGRDTFTIDLADRLYMEDVGIHTGLPLRISLDPNAETNVSFSVNASSDAAEDAYEMLVTVKSDAQPQTAADTVTFTVVVERGLIDDITDPTAILLFVAVAAAFIALLLATRQVKRRRSAREARRQLQKVLRQRREAGGVERADEAAPPLPEPPPSPQKVRVKVKAPPRP